MSHLGVKRVQPAPDPVLVDIASYAMSFEITSQEAYDTARHCLLGALASGFQSLAYPACTTLLGPVVPGATMAGGARVPGTSYELDPVQAAFNIGTMIGWLDSNDTGLAAARGQPSDNLGGILAVADYLARKAVAEGTPPPVVRDVLTAMIKAHEIQGVTALENSFDRVGLDPVILVRVASTAVVTAMLGGTQEQVVNAVSNAWLDGGALCSGRHAPNGGSRQRWAAGDATSRGVRHAFLALGGEMGCPAVLSARTWGFYDVLFEGAPFVYRQPFGSCMIENALFNIGHPAGLHAQTAVECAMTLHPQVTDRLDFVEKVVIETQGAVQRSIDTGGPLADRAGRDRCIRYVVAIPLIFGRLAAADYEDAVASDPRVDALRRKTTVQENETSTAEYHAPDKRHMGNSVQVFFKDGTRTDRVVVDVPVGHRKRRAEGIPALVKKFESSIAEVFGAKQCDHIRALFADWSRVDAMSVHEFVSAFVRN